MAHRGQALLLALEIAWGTGQLNSLTLSVETTPLQPRVTPGTGAEGETPAGAAEPEPQPSSPHILSWLTTNRMDSKGSSLYSKDILTSRQWMV